uniref:Uncharacterized protein n=1 Tax=Amphimedon queenslandica TaxID=400682 RepID=A0A1X7VTT1_AMPQE
MCYYIYTWRYTEDRHIDFASDLRLARYLCTWHKDKDYNVVLKTEVITAENDLLFQQYFCLILECELLVSSCIMLPSNGICIKTESIISLIIIINNGHSSNRCILFNDSAIRCNIMIQGYNSSHDYLINHGHSYCKCSSCTCPYGLLKAWLLEYYCTKSCLSRWSFRRWQASRSRDCYWRWWWRWQACSKWWWWTWRHGPQAIAGSAGGGGGPPGGSGGGSPSPATGSAGGGGPPATAGSGGGGGGPSGGGGGGGPPFPASGGRGTPFSS